MTTYSNAEYYEMVRCYLLSGESLNGAQRMYRTESLPRLLRRGINSRVPNRQTILAANQRLLDYGQFTTPAHATGRGGTTAITPAVESAVLECFERDPCASTNDAARRFGVSQYYVWKLLNSSGYHPYHYQPVQSLQDNDGPARMEFCEETLIATFCGQMKLYLLELEFITAETNIIGR